MSEWQPIETAPRDERFILVFAEHGIDVAYFFGERVVGARTALLWCNNDVIFEATHWMPLPAPP